MRVHLAIVLSLICCSAGIAGEKRDVTFSTTIPATATPVSIGRPHSCTDSYPAAAIQAHAEGTTTLAFTITTAGTVTDIKIAKSSGNRDLDDAAVACASQWLYRPATKDTIPVDAPWQANVVWKFGEPKGMRLARECLVSRKAAVTIPPGTGTTRVVFRVLPDGKLVDVKLAGSSGDKTLDDAGLECAADAHLDVSLLTLPAAGIPGHVEFQWDWLRTATPPATSAAPQKN